jgi:hypothetical protein
MSSNPATASSAQIPASTLPANPQSSTSPATQTTVLPQAGAPPQAAGAGLRVEARAAAEAPPQPLPPMRRVSQLIIGLWVPQAVHAAAELGVADLLAGGPRTSAEIAAALGTHADSTERLLRALVTLGLLEADGGDRFALTETGQCLVDDAQPTARAWARLMGGPVVWDAWGRLTECIRTGQTASQLRGAALAALAPDAASQGDNDDDNEDRRGGEVGSTMPDAAHRGGGSGGGEHNRDRAAFRGGAPAVDPFEMMAREPEAAAVFHRAMYDLTRGSAAAIVSAVDWSGVRDVIDVGGGYGALLCAILEAQPHVRGAVFDLPHARDGALACFASRGLRDLHGVRDPGEPRELSDLSDRATYIEGSLFADALPAADAYIMKSVIHDWNDEKSIEILRACRAAMHPAARLLLVEPPAMPAGVNPMLDWMIAFSDLNMLVNCGGRERTEAQYTALLDVAGLRTVAIHPTSGFYRVFEAVRRD